MKVMKTIFKMLCVLFFLVILIFVVALIGESYKVSDKVINGKNTKVEIKSIWGKKMFEAMIDSKGFYHGEFKSWHLFKKDLLRVKSHFKNGFLHGEQKDYDRSGKLIMVRTWKEGKLIQAYILDNRILKEISEDKWSRHIKIQPKNQLRAKKYEL